MTCPVETHANDRRLLQRRCPRLGGPVTFEYCETGADKLNPCWKILDCWWEIFDVVTYLKQNFPRDKFEKLSCTQPKPKMKSLLELIAAAKKNTTLDKTD